MPGNVSDDPCDCIYSTSKALGKDAISQGHRRDVIQLSIVPTKTVSLLDPVSLAV